MQPYNDPEPDLLVQRRIDAVQAQLTSAVQIINDAWPEASAPTYTAQAAVHDDAPVVVINCPCCWPTACIARYGVERIERDGVTPRFVWESDCGEPDSVIRERLAAPSEAERQAVPLSVERYVTDAVEWFESKGIEFPELGAAQLPAHPLHLATPSPVLRALRSSDVRVTVSEVADLPEHRSNHVTLGQLIESGKFPALEDDI